MPNQPNPTPEQQAQYLAQWGHEPGMQVATQCTRCRQRFRGAPPRCNAFPDGIPWELLIGDVDHTTPYPGDGGTRYTPPAPTEPDGPLTYVYIHTGFLHQLHCSAGHHSANRTIGALWLTERNNAIGFVPAPGWELTDEVATWQGRVYLGGPSIHRSARELFDGWQERCSGQMWACSVPERVDTLDALRSALARLPGAPG